MLHEPKHIPGQISTKFWR